MLLAGSKLIKGDGILMCDGIVTFHKTVRGFRHIQEDSPCQDSSLSYATKLQNGFQIICIADGHGDPACHRSDTGSHFATEIAVQCLRDFAKSLLAGELLFSSPRHQSECMKQLTTSIISKWYEAIHDDLKDRVVTEEDYAEADPYHKEAYRKGEKLAYLYGTTLIAALCVKNYLLLIQQGDGRCEVLYADGTVDQPIPWDERCKGSETTSMSSKDVFNSIRSKVIDLSKEDVIACFVGSDGVEDSYYDNEETQLGTHRFYMDLCCKLCEYGVDRFPEYLDTMLPDLSKTGSGDDISVAGIVDLYKVSLQVDAYSKKVKKYDTEARLKADLDKVQAKIISMTRKHNILSDKVTEAESRLLDGQKEKQKIETNLRSLQAKRDEQAAERLKQYDREIQAMENALAGITAKVNQLETALETVKKEYLEYDAQFIAANKKKEDLESELRSL